MVSLAQAYGLQLAGLQERTQAASTDAAQQLEEGLGRAREQLTQAEAGVHRGRR